jgi:hypothetical protein
MSLIPARRRGAVKNGRFRSPSTTTGGADGVLSPVRVRVHVDRTRLTQTMYALFGLALLASNGVSLRSSVDPLPLLAAVVSAGVVASAVVGLVRPDATVRGVRLGVGERPTWVLALLGVGTVLLFAGAILEL